MVLLGRIGRGDGVREALQATAESTIITMMRCDVGASEDANHAQLNWVRFVSARVMGPHRLASKDRLPQRCKLMLV